MSGPTDPRSRLLTDLGFTIPDKIAELTGDKEATDISRERLDLLDAEVLLPQADSPQALRDTMRNDPLYRRLAVARQGRDLLVTGDLEGALSFSTVLSLPFAIDGLVPRLTAAIDGDPSTRPNRPSAPTSRPFHGLLWSSSAISAISCAARAASGEGVRCARRSR